MMPVLSMSGQYLQFLVLQKEKPLFFAVVWVVFFVFGLLVRSVTEEEGLKSVLLVV